MRRVIITCIVLVLGFAAPALLRAQHNEHHGRFEFTAVASSIGLPGNPTGKFPVDIVVTRWSTDAERKELLGALTKDGQDALLRKLRARSS